MFDKSYTQRRYLLKYYLILDGTGLLSLRESTVMHHNHLGIVDAAQST